MFTKAGALAKELPALAALVRLLSRVDALVANQCGFAAERFPTLTAVVRPLSCVNSLVLDKYVFVAESFPAFTALIRPLSSVDSLMLSKSVLAAEGFPTVTALVLPMVRGLCTHTVLGCLPLAPKTQGTSGVPPSLGACGGLLWCVGYTALRPGGLVCVLAGQILSIVLLLQLVKFPTCLQQFLPRVYSQVIS